MAELAHRYVRTDADLAEGYDYPRLLAADPAHQGLEMRLAGVPQPCPPQEKWAADPAFRHIQGSERHHVSYPEFMAVHDMPAARVEECRQLLRQPMRSVSYGCLAHPPGYPSWLCEQGAGTARPAHRCALADFGLTAEKVDERFAGYLDAYA